MRKTAQSLVVASVMVAVLPATAGTLVVANKSEATVSLVDTGSGEIRATLPTGNAPHEVAVSPDGRLALIGNYGTREAPGSTLTLISVPEAKVVSTIELRDFTRPHGIVWIDNRFALVTVEDQQAIVQLDVPAGEVVRKIATGAEISHMVAVARGHGLAFVTNIGSGSVSVIDLALGKEIAEVATGDGAEGVAVTPDGRQLWVTNRAENTITVINPANRKIIAELPAGEFPIRAEATGNGRAVLVTNAKSNDLTVFSTDPIAEVGRVRFEAVSKGGEGRLFSDRFGSSSVPIGIEIVDDEMRAYVAHANADDISIVDLRRWEVVGAIAAGREPDGMGYSALVANGAR